MCSLTWTNVLGKPSFAAVATSGSYLDLSNRPTLATVATTGSYNDLTNKPTIPAAYAVGYPTTRTVALATAYQCTTNTKPCIFTVTVTSTASLSLTAGTTNQADILVGSTNGVATGTGTVIAKYSNSMTGTLVVGLGVNTIANATYTVAVPTGGYVAVRQTSGTVTIVSAYDQSSG